LLLRAGLSHRGATLYISLFNVFIIVVAFLLDSIGIFLLSFTLLVLCLIGVGVLLSFVRQKESEARMAKFPFSSHDDAIKKQEPVEKALV